MNLGERIQQLRKAAGLSQEQLAEMIGVSRQAISKWETDQSMPEIEKVVSLSKAFSVCTDELLGNEAAVSVAAPPSQLAGATRLNMKRRQFTVGWITVVVGLVMLAAEYFSLRLLQLNAMKLELEYASGTGFFADPMRYAGIEPMPTVFAITAVIIVVGVGLTAFSLVHKNK